MEFFLSDIVGADYLHLPMLAPNEEILKAWQRKQLKWDEFEKRFLSLMGERKIETQIDRKLFEPRSVMLCSEPKPDRCHRRLVVEYLQDKWNGFEIRHL